MNYHKLFSTTGVINVGLIGAGAFETGADDRRDPVEVDPVGAGDQQQHGPVIVGAAEDQRLDDLPDLTAACLGRFLRRSGTLRHFGDRYVQTGRRGGLSDPVL